MDISRPARLVHFVQISVITFIGKLVWRVRPKLRQAAAGHMVRLAAYRAALAKHRLQLPWLGCVVDLRELREGVSVNGGENTGQHGGVKAGQ